MLSREILQEQLAKYDFDQFVHKEANGRRRIRLLVADLKEDKNCSEVTDALRVTRHAVIAGCSGLPRVASWIVWRTCPILGAPSGFPKRRKKPFVRRSTNCKRNAAAAASAPKRFGSSSPSSSISKNAHRSARRSLQDGMRYWYWTAPDGIPHRSCHSCPICHCCLCLPVLRNSILPNRYGNNCATGIWRTAVSTVTTRSSMPGTPSRKSRGPFAPFARVVGLP